MGSPAISIDAAECMTIPDVCKTPTPAGPIPIPYPNTGTTLMANPATIVDNVFIAAMPAVVEESEIMMSEGDDLGVAGGIISSMFIGPISVELGSVTVFIGGRGAAYVGSLTGHNGDPNSNMPVGVLDTPSPPGTVLVAP